MRTRFPWVGLALPALSLPPAAGAADSVAGPPPDTIVVTATRLPQPLERIGSAVSLVTREQIVDRQVTAGADALRGVPGLAIARSGPAGAQTQVRMRGAEANQVLVLIDGVEANDLAGADEFAFEHLSTFDIERIEVVRGPQSALWGSDALAGLINVVTRRPEEGLQTEAFLEGGSFGTVNGGAYAGARAGRGYASLSASRFDSDGSNAARSGAETDGYDNTTATATGGFEWSPALRFDANLRHTSAGKDYDGESLTTGLPADDANGDGRVDVFSTDVRQDYLRIGANWDPLGGHWTHQLNYGVTDTSTDTRSEDLYSAGTIDRSTQDGRKYGLYYQTSVKVTPDGPDQPADVLTLAVDHEREEFSQRGKALDFGPGFVYDPNQDQSLEVTGVVAEYLASFGNDLTLTASARHDGYSDFDDATTWRGTASWRPTGGPTRLHASLGTGVKTPTFTERFGFYPQQFVGNPDLKPEKSTGWDAGVEQRFAGGRVVTDATYFHADLEDEINGLYCPTTEPLCTAANEDGRSVRRGVELSLDARVNDTWTVNAAYTYTDASQPVPSGGDEHEVRRPWHVASLFVDGKWLAGRLDVNAGLTYTGERGDNFFDPVSYAASRVALGSYTLVNLAASYEVTRHLSVYGRIENALDSDYEDVYGFNTPGAAGYLGLRLSMGR